MLDGLIENRVDHKKQRHGGITYIIYKFQGFDSDNFEIISHFVDMLKIYGAYPLLLSDNNIIKMINLLHDKII